MAEARLKAFAERTGWQLPLPDWAVHGKVQIRVSADGPFQAGGQHVLGLPAAVIRAYGVWGEAPPPGVMKAALHAMATPRPPKEPMAMDARRDGEHGGDRSSAGRPEDGPERPATDAPATPSADPESGAIACIRLLAFAGLAGWTLCPPYRVSDGPAHISVSPNGLFVAGDEIVPSLPDAVSNAYKAQGVVPPERAMEIARIIMSRPPPIEPEAVAVRTLRPLPLPTPIPAPPSRRKKQRKQQEK